MTDERLKTGAIEPAPQVQKSARGKGGRFLPGNPGGPGNPFIKRVAKLRALLLDAVGEADLREIVQKLVESAKAGDMVAVRELFNRLFGRPGEAVEPDRVIELVARIRADEIEAQEHLRLCRRFTTPLSSGGTEEE